MTTEPMASEPVVAPESTPVTDAPARLEPQRYCVQFEASEEYVELVERAKALLSHEHESAGLAELHLRAMRALVAERRLRARRRPLHLPLRHRERCRETSRLELHHQQAFALGGEHLLENITLRCRAHNALAAEEDFGKELIVSARDSSQHEPWAAQDPDDAGRLRFSD